MLATKVALASDRAARDSVGTSAGGRDVVDQQAGGPVRAIVVMGVSGVGKSTLGMMLAKAWDAPFLEGDDYHAPASVAKMRAGAALTDADRWPWLDRLGAALGDTAREKGAAVAACSALRHAYRMRLEHAAGMPLRFVLLHTAAGEIARRMTARSDHYMPATLLDSQLATLERPVPGETALVLDAARAPAVLCEEVDAWLAITAHR